MHILWSEEALSDYNQNIQYLIDEWSAKAAFEFIKEFERTIDSIEKNPLSFAVINYKNIRKAVIRKQITLFFYINEQELVLIRIWNNYKDPKGIML